MGVACAGSASRPSERATPGASALSSSSPPVASSAAPVAAAEPTYERAKACTDAAPAPSAGPRPAQVLQGRGAAKLHALAFSADGALATLGDDFTIRLWDADRRFLLRAIRLAEMPLVSPELAWDGRGERLSVLSVGGYDSYDLHGARVANVDAKLAMPDGRKRSPLNVGLVASSRFGALAAIVRTPLPNGNDAFGPFGPAQLVYWPAFDKPGQTIAIADPTSAVLDAAGATIAATVAKGNDVREYASDLYLATTAPAAPRKIWSTDGWARALAIAPDAKTIAVAVHDRDPARFKQPRLVVVDAARGAVLWSRPGETEDERGAPADAGIELAAFSPNGALLAVATRDGRVQTYEPSTGRYQGTLGVKPRHPSRALLVRDDTVAVLSNDDATRESHVTLVSLKDGAPKRSSPVPEAAFVDATPGGDLVMIARGGRFARCEKNGRMLGIERWAGALPALSGAAAIDDDSRCVDGLSLVHDVLGRQGKLLVSRSVPENGVGPKMLAEYAIYDLKTRAATKLEGARGLLSSAVGGRAFSDDGRYLAAQGASSGDDLAWTVWDARTGKVVKTGIGIKRARDNQITATAIAIAPNVDRVAVALGKTISVRDLRSQTEIARLDLDADAQAVRFGPDASLLVAGDSAGALYAFKDGKRLAKGGSDGGGILGIEIDSAGKVATTIASDDAVRVWDVPTATVRAALAEFADDEWIAFTPGGAYTGTSEVADRVGWVFDAPLEGFTFEQFAGSFRDDALVKRRLAGEAIEASGAALRPPRVSVRAPPPREVDGATVKLRVHASADSRVDVVRAFVEARPVAEKAVCAASGDVDLDVPLLGGNNRVTLVAFDARGSASNPLSFDLVSKSASGAPDVWVVAVGVNRYKNLPESMQLDAADDDARAVAAAFSSLAPGSYAKAHVFTLTDDKATPASIAQAASELAAMKPNDVAVVFFAGHGFKPSAGADMVFMTGGAELRSDGKGVTDESLKRDGVMWSDLAAALGRARGRVVVMLDACHSGHVSQALVVPNEALASALVRDQRAGAIVFAASKGRQVSYEGGTTRGLQLAPATTNATTDVRFTTQEPHGFFTGALLAALSDPTSDRNGDGALQASEVIDEVTRRVVRASRSRQTPWVARRDLFGDFALAPAVKK